MSGIKIACVILRELSRMDDNDHIANLQQLIRHGDPLHVETERDIVKAEMIAKTLGRIAWNNGRQRRQVLRPARPQRVGSQGGPRP